MVSWEFGAVRYLDDGLRRKLIRLCEDIAGSSQITAAIIAGDYTSGANEFKIIPEIFLVIPDFQPKLMSYIKALDGRNIIVIAVDEWIFERDVDRGFLGEAIAEKMIFPYIALASTDYLRIQEVKLKKRLVLELLENLVLDFPELSRNLYVAPEYFVYETMVKRAKLFPPMIYRVMKFMQGNVRDRNVKLVMHGYLKGLKELEKEDVITFSNGYVRISEDFVDKVEIKKTRFINVFKTAQRTLFNTLLGIFSRTMSFLSQNRQTILEIQWDAAENSKPIYQLEDPLRYLYIPTASRLVPLSDRMSIEAFAKKVLSKDEGVEVKIEKIGGVLNDVYLVLASSDDEEKRAVVKKFRDLSSFKWFPLNLWSLGTRSFAVLGLSRLERECAINQQLYDAGFDVPKILHVSHVERLVFMEYVDGEKLDRIIRKIANPKRTENIDYQLKVISRIGERFARVHAQGIALGDTKPENVMIREKTGEVCLLDLEQASRNGDKIWDIAEFLYYAGHYVPPFAGTHLSKLIARAFVQGYLKTGGDIEIVRKAGTPKYTKVFSVLTFPSVILAMSNVCRNWQKEKTEISDTD